MNTLNISNIEIRNRIISAPLAGVTDLPFRKIIRGLHDGLMCSEMVSSQSLVRCKSKKLYEEQIDPEDSLTSVQILGRNPKYMADSAKLLKSMGVKIIDINMGCSVRKVIKQKEGSALIYEPDLACEIIEAVVNAVDVPVTLKIRKSFQDKTSEEIITRCGDLGIKAIALHGRSQEQLYSGQADWDYVGEMQSKISVPLIGNGDIKTPEDALIKLKKYGCKAVMIGRGILGNPWILKETHCLDNNLEYTSVKNSEKLDKAKQHFNLAIEIEGEITAFKKIRKHLSWYIKGMPMASIMRDKIFHTRNNKELLRLWDAYFVFIAETETVKEIHIGDLEPMFAKYVN